MENMKIASDDKTGEFPFDCIFRRNKIALSEKAKEEKAKRFEKMTAQKKSLSTGIIYFLLLIFIYVCSYFLFGFSMG